MGFQLRTISHVLFLVFVVGGVSTTSIFEEIDHEEQMKQGSLGTEIHNFKVSRISREEPIVQPDLSPELIFGGLFKNYDVHVTEQKLEETEAIREIIQETVETGTYAVEMDESDFQDENEQVQESGEPEASPGSESQQESESEQEPKSESESESEEEVLPTFEPAPELVPESPSEPETEPESQLRSSIFAKLRLKPRKNRKFRLRGLLTKWIKNKCLFGKCKK